MGKVVRLPVLYKGPLKTLDTENNAFLAGFAAGLCDAWRAGDVPQALQDSGISYQAFIDANINEYDLEEIGDMFSCL